MLNILLRFLGFESGAIRSVESAVIHLSWGWAAFILAILVVLPIAWFTYRFEGKSINEKTKKKLLTLRIVWLILVAFLLTGPTLVISGWVPLQNRIAVMLDTSKSMSIREEGTARFDRIKKVVEGGFIQKLESKTGIYPDVFSFADYVSPVAPSEINNFALKPTGNQTGISAAVKSVVSHLGESNLLGIIMLTDGVNTVGENPMNILSNQKVPVYFVSPGHGGDVTDYALFVPKPPAFGFLNSGIKVRGEVSARVAGANDKTETVEVTVKRDGETFQTIPVELKGNGVKVPFSFNIPCKEEGSFRFEVEIPVKADELTEENNKTGFLLKVVKERLNVVALSGLPNWDMKFLGNALAGDPNASFIHWARVSDSRWISSKDFQPQNGVENPDFSEALENADVLVLSGISYPDLQKYEKTIINRLESGVMGLLVMPAHKNLTQLGFSGTELAKRLPVELGEETWRGTPGNMLLPSTETSYSFLQMYDDPIENQNFYSTLPKFDGVYEFKSIKAGTEVLLDSTVTGSRNKLPFMIRNRAGLGNVIMINGAPIWPIGFMMVNSEGGFSHYSGMMVNMLKWLANRREDAQVSIELANSRGYIGTSSIIRVWVSDSNHQLMANSRVSLTIKDEKGSDTELVCVETSEAGCYETAFVPASRGLHKITAKASYQGKDLGSAESELFVETPTAEFDEPMVKTDVMMAIASETGGIMVFDDEADKLVASINSVPGKKLESKSLDMRDCWLLLLLVILLPAAEWYIRRTGGLS